MPNIVGRPRATPTRRCATRSSRSASPRRPAPTRRRRSSPRSRPRARSSRAARRSTSSSRPGRREGQEEGRGEGRRQEGRQGRRGRRAAAAAAAVARRRHHRPGDRQADTKTYAKAAADLGIVPVAKQFNDAPADTLFPTEPPGGTKVKPKAQGDSCSSRSASRRWCSPTARTSCASTARNGAPARPGRRDRGRGEGPDLERRRHPCRLHRRRPGDAQGPDQEELEPVPLTPGEREVRRPRLGADRRTRT